MSGRSTSTHGAVTPQGIRDAEPLVLALLVERRAGRVLAYGDEVARPDLALQAASEAFAAFRIAVATADQADALDPEAALLHATREAAARHAENPYRPSGRERPERRTTACELMPRLLVAWTEGRLSVEDEQRLVRHLRRCPDCRALKDAFARAEERYRGGSGATLDSTETSVIVSTMAAVQIPVAGAAPAPEPPAAEGAAPAPDASPEPPVAADAADLADVPEPSAEQPLAAGAEHPVGDVEEPPVEPQAPVAAPAADAALDGAAPETAADAPPADSDDGDDPAWSDSDTWEDEPDADPVPLDDPWEEEPHDEAVPEPAAAPSAEWDEIVLSPSDPLGPEAMGYVVPQPGLPRPTARTRRGLRRRRPLPRRDPAAARRADQARHVPDVAVPPPVEAAAAEPVSFEPSPVAEPPAAEPSPVEPPLAEAPPLAEPLPVEAPPLAEPSPVEAEPVAAQPTEEPPVEAAAAVEPPSNADVEPPVEPEPDVPATDIAAEPAAAEPPHEVATVEPAPAAPLPVPIADAPPSDAVPAAPSPLHNEPPPAREPDVAHDAVQPPSYAAVPAPEPASAESLHADPHPQPEQPTTVLPATITAGGAPPATAAPRSHGVVATVVRQLGIPAVLLVIVLLAALAAAGVFSSDDQTPTPTSPARQTVPTDPSQLPPLEMPR